MSQSIGHYTFHACVQALGQVAALRQQQALLRTHVQGEVALASSECTHQLESAQYKLRQKAMLMQGEAQGESLTIAKLQSYISQVCAMLCRAVLCHAVLCCTAI